MKRLLQAVAGVALLSLGQGSAAAAVAAPPAAPPPAVTAEAAPTAATAALGERRISLGSLSGQPAETLKGVEGLYSWKFGLRLDQVVRRARLQLKFTASPALLPELSHLQIRLNGVAVAALPLPREAAGTEQQREVELPAQFFTDYNQLSLILVGHYSTGCEDPEHSSLWASINGDSALVLDVEPLDLSPDLSRLPAPFFDRRDTERLVLPFVFPAAPGLSMEQSAGIVATWFGALSDYRGADFPVLLDRLPQGHAVVFATNARQPQGLSLPSVSRPTLRILENPTQSSSRLLVLQGQDEAQLQQAAEGLVLGSNLLSGAVASLKDIQLPERRPAYDAPNWLPTNRPARLGELVTDLQDLQAEGHAPGPIQLRVRMAPDLFTWNRDGIPLQFRYRYTPPTEDDNSMLTVSANDQIVRSFRLKPGEAVEAEGSLRIPPYLLTTDNSLSFQFAVDYHRPGPCRDSGMDLVRSAIDPEASTIDVSGYSHYAEMPNLRLFANGGYPFTRYADLAETALLLPPTPSVGDLEAAYQLLGRLGAITGTAGLRLRMASSESFKDLGDRDLLMVGDHPVLHRWQQNLPALLDREVRSSGALARAGLWFRRGLAGDGARLGDKGGVTANSTGDLAALVGFESPEKSGRSVVALLYNSDTARRSALTALASPGVIADIRGDSAIIRGGEVNSFNANGRYAVGRLSPLTWLWLQFSRHPGWITVLMLLAALLAAAAAYGYLRKVAARRVEPT